MKIPQYLFDRLDLIRSPKKAGRALRHYSKRLDQMVFYRGRNFSIIFEKGDSFSVLVIWILSLILEGIVQSRLCFRCIAIRMVLHWMILLE